MTGETMLSIALGVCMGVAATVTMDVLSSASRRFGLAAGAEGQWLGRWYLGMLRGRFIHKDITVSPVLEGEKQAALVGHFVIGITLAVLYVVGADWLGFSPGVFFIALGYGFATCVFPWFLLFPALGFGFFGLRAPPELRLFTASLMNHLFYGFGLWWSVRIFTLIPGTGV